MLIALELYLMNADHVLYKRVGAAVRLLEIWGSLRSDDTAGRCPKLKRRAMIAAKLKVMLTSIDFMPAFVGMPYRAIVTVADAATVDGGGIVHDGVHC